MSKNVTSEKMKPQHKVIRNQWSLSSAEGSTIVQQPANNNDSEGDERWRTCRAVLPSDLAAEDAVKPSTADNKASKAAATTLSVNIFSRYLLSNIETDND